MATLGVLRPLDVAVRLVANFAKARPARRAFAFSGDLLGGCPPLFDQLQQRLAPAAQPVAFLDRVEHRHRRPRQLQQHLLTAGGPEALAVGSGVFSGAVRLWHPRTRLDH
jgi:hypothetical protein